MRNGENFTQKELESAQEAIGYHFKNIELLETCFTHKSYSNAFGGRNNERLEFLGDAVLQLCVTEELFLNSPSDEGVLTEQRQTYVSQAALAEAASRAGIMRYMRYSGGEHNVGGKTASNLFEALVGGVYLDGGMEEVKKMLSRFLKHTESGNYKTRLQEFVQERTKKTPSYFITEEEGGYTCRVCAMKKEAYGFGESKKAAETQAAEKLYQILVKGRLS